MPFDLTSAQPVASKKFDIASAKPVSDESSAPAGVPEYTPEQQALIAQNPDYKELIDADIARSKVAPHGVMDVVKGMGRAAVGVGETVLSGVTGLVPAAANIVNRTLGITPLLTAPGQSIGDYEQGVRNEFTYQPRTDDAKGLQTVLGATVGRAFALPGEGIKHIETALGADPAQADADAKLTSDVLALVTAKGAAPEAAAVEDLPKVQRPIGSIPDSPTAAMRAADIKLSPSASAKAEGAPSAPGSTLESFAGSSGVQKDLATANQSRITQLAAQDIGLPADSPRITPKALDAQRAAPIAKYAEVGQAVGNFAPSDALTKDFDAISQQTGLTPEARAKIAADVDQYRGDQFSGPDVVKTISALRRRAQKELQSDDVNTQDVGNAHRQIADAYEGELAHQLQASGNPQLVTEFQNARTQLAKINNVDTMTKAGQIDPAIATRLRNKGAPLSGNLGIIADAGEYGAPVVKHAQSINPEEASSPIPFLNPLLDIASAGIRPLARKYIKSDMFQNRLGKPAANLSSDSRLGDYFAQPEQAEAPKTPTFDEPPPTPASAMLEAQKRAGNLELAPEPMRNAQVLPAVPSRLTADTPPPTPSGIPFKASEPTLADLLAGHLQLAPNQGAAESLHTGVAPRAAGMSEQVPGTRVFPELRAVRNGKDEAIPLENSGIDVQEGTLADALGLPHGMTIKPSAKNGGGYAIFAKSGEPVAHFKNFSDAFGAATDPELINNTFGAATDPELTNNASGESAASAEAIGRVAEEKALKRQRYLVDKDDTIRPLVGVDAIDTVAKPGQIIVQRNVGAKEWTVWDRGDLPKQQADGKLARIMNQLHGSANGTR